MDSVGMSILRRIYELVAQKRVKYVIAMVPPQTARYLLNARRSELAMIERQYHLTIEIVAVDGMPASNVVLEHLEEAPAETGSDRADRTKLLRVHQELDLVRNHLIKREEARVQLEMASARRAARVDYSEIYREVREMSGDDDVRKPRTRNRRRKAQGFLGLGARTVWRRQVHGDHRRSRGGESGVGGGTQRSPGARGPSRSQGPRSARRARASARQGGA
jgi:hypothetical protein